MKLFLLWDQLCDQTNLTLRKFWLGWFVALLVISGVHASSLVYFPNLWVDEVQITEYGRVTFDPHTNWSINWEAQEEIPLPPITYLGCALQEVAYRVTGSPVGPRITSLLGGMLAATLLVGWLLSRKTPKLASGVLGVLFFLDPYFVVSYRFARVDCWSLALCFGVCWMIRKTMTTTETVGPPPWLVVFIGSTTSFNFFLWPTSVVFFPLVCVEYFLAVKEKYPNWGNYRDAFQFCAGLALSGILSAMILALPMKPLHLGWLGRMTKLQARDDYTDYAGYSLARFLQIGRGFLNFCTYCPIFPVGILAGLGLIRSQWKIWLALLGAVFAISLSRVYIFRVIYLLPYACIFLGSYLQWSHQQSQKIWYGLRFSYAGLLLLLVWTLNFAFHSWVLAPLHYKPTTDMSLLNQAGTNSIGAGSYRVYLDNFSMSFYYVGRKLGWHMYRPYTSFKGGEAYALDNEKLFSKVDYAIIWAGNTYLISQLEKAGFHQQGRLVNLKENDDYHQDMALEIWPYGPYLLFSRKSPLPVVSLPKPKN